MIPYELGEHDHAEILARIIREKLDPIPAVEQPRLYMLGGQPGAGKTALRRPIKDAHVSNGIVDIDPDELKTYHPKYVEFLEEDAETASRRTRPDVAKWLLELREAAFSKKVNVLFDAPLGAAAEPIDWAGSARLHGYEVEVHILAVPWEVSFQAVRERFEMSHDQAARHEGPPESRPLPRNVREESQRANYEGLVGSVATISQSGLVSRLRITNRSGKTLADTVEASAITAAAQAEINPFTAALETERNRHWDSGEIRTYREKAAVIEELMSARLSRTTGPERDRLVNDLTGFRERHRTVIAAQATEVVERSDSGQTDFRREESSPMVPLQDQLHPQQLDSTSAANPDLAAPVTETRETEHGPIFRGHRTREVRQRIGQLPMALRIWLERCCCIPRGDGEVEM